MPADIGTTLVSWVSTSGSNQPQGTTSVSSNLDDNMREFQGVIVRGLSHKGADIASAATTDLGAVEGLFHDITGTTTITSFGTVRVGIVKKIKFEGVLILTHNATSLILKYAQNHLTTVGDVFEFISEGSGNWREMSRNVAGGDVAPGIIMDDGGTTAPDGWLQCFGQAVSRTTYSAIFARYSTTYGVGDGVTTFNLPDCRGRVIAGKDNMGGTSTNRLTGASGGVDGDVLGGVGGVETHTLTAAESGSPDHTHSYVRGGIGPNGGNGWTGSGVNGPDLTGGASNGGANATQAHNNVQPTIILNKIIKT